MGTKSGKAPFISKTELKKTLKAMNGAHAARNKAVLMFSHFLGLRAKEMALLKLGDVYDIRQKKLKETIRLLRAYTKGDKYREVFLVDNLTQQYVLNYIQDNHKNLSAESPLFISQKGGSFSPNSMQRMIANCYKQAGIYGTSHSGRRSFATGLMEKNVDIFSIKQLMGHTSIQTTQEYFSSDPIRLKQQLYKLSQ